MSKEKERKREGLTGGQTDRQKINQRSMLSYIYLLFDTL